MSELSGKVALVTGGGVRLGKALAEGLASAGASVIVHCHRSEEAAQFVAGGIAERGGRAKVLAADLTQPSACADLVARGQKALGPIDILVNSAALFERAPLEDATAEQADRLWALNARAPLLLSQAVAPQMKRRGRGDILNLVDLGGHVQWWRNYAAYCMSKAALASMTYSLAAELAPSIRVNGIAPGAILPPDDWSAEQLESLRAKIPQGRFGSPSDIVQTAVFLLSGPQFITGQILSVDGGRQRG